MLWLSDGGDQAIDALWAAWEDHRQLLFYRADEDEKQKDTAPPGSLPAGGDAEARERALFGNVSERFAA